MDMTGFRWEKAEAWKSDWDFGKEFQGKIEKLAMVGDKAWESMVTKGFGSKYAQQANYFDADSISSASFTTSTPFNPVAILIPPYI